MKYWHYHLILLLALLSENAFAQQTSNRLRNTQKPWKCVRLVTNEGDTLVGRIVSRDSTTISLELIDSTFVSYLLEDVGIYRREKVKTEDLTDENIERIYLSATAFSLDKGEKEYRNAMLFYNGFQKGITENFSFGAAAIPAIFFNLIFLNAKATIQIHKNIHVWASLVGGTGLVGDLGIKPEALYYAGEFGLLTIGSKKRFLNVSVGHVWGKGADDDYATGLAYSIGARFKLKKSSFFIEVDKLPGYSDLPITFSGFNFKIKKLNYEAGLMLELGRIWIVLPAIGLSKRF